MADSTVRRADCVCKQCGKAFRPRTNSKGEFCSRDCKATFRYSGHIAKYRSTSGSPVFIYALVDPVTRFVRYVGKSEEPQERTTVHCNDKSRTHRANWIRSILAKGIR